MEPGANGLAYHPMLQAVLACQHGERRVVAFAPDGSERILATSYGGRRLNSPNDLVIDVTTGDVYFTDPSYGSWVLFE